MTRTSSVPFHPGTPWGLFRFEAPEAGGAPAVAEPAGVDHGADPGMGDQPAPWEGISQEQWEESERRNAAVYAWAQQQAAEAQRRAAGEEQVRFDAFSDDPDSQLRAIVGEMIAPLLESHDQMGLAAGQELAYDVIEDFTSREGEFLHDGAKDLAFSLARGFMPQAIERYGHTDRAGEAALEAACKHVKQLEETIGKAYHERQTNQLATLAGARREPGQGGAAPQLEAGPYGRGQRVTDRFFGGGQ